MMAVTVVVPQQVVALPVVVVAPHLLDVAVVVTTLLARMIAGTVTTNVGTAIALAVQTTGEIHASIWLLDVLTLLQRS